MKKRKMNGRDIQTFNFLKNFEKLIKYDYLRTPK